MEFFEVGDQLPIAPTQPVPPQGQPLMVFPPPLEPLRTNRFVVTFPEQFHIPEYIVSHITRPRYILHNGWGDITVEFREVVAPSTSQLLLNLMWHCVGNALPENPPANSPPLFILTLDMLDPTGVVVQRWHMHVKNLEDTNWGMADYEQEDIAAVRMRFSVFRCELVY